MARQNLAKSSVWLVAEETPSAGGPAPSGICCTCLHGSACALPARVGDALWSCNEFEVAEAPPVEVSTSNAVALSTSMVLGHPGEPRGDLCSDCVHRNTCMFAGPDGGVWHCEEYE